MQYARFAPRPGSAVRNAAANRCVRRWNEGHRSGFTFSQGREGVAATHVAPNIDSM